MSHSDHNLENASKRLIDLFLNTDIDKVDVTDYTKRYFKEYLPKIHFAADTARRTILAGIHSADVKIEDSIIIESGGGIGLLSFLSALAGVKKVIYNDLFEGSCHDFQKIAKAFNIEGISVVHGSSDAIRIFCNEKKIVPHLVVSRNVIEHVYSIPDYLKELRSISDKMVLSFSTTANYSNPLVRFYTQKIHKKIEYRGTGNHYGKKSSDTTQPYKLLRWEYIRKKFPDLKPDIVDKYTAETRGLIYPDIDAYIEKRQKGISVLTPAYGTNTCDPNTGNWAENLLPYLLLKEQFREGGYKLEILPGHWNTSYKKASLRTAAILFNGIMKVFPFSRKALSPYIILVAKPS